MILKINFLVFPLTIFSFLLFMGTLDDSLFLKNQVLTYIGNKRKFLNVIEEAIVIILNALNKDKLITLDLFSGSGIVARLLKGYSKTIIANDLEDYSYLINQCYLSNKDELDIDLFNSYLKEINNHILSNPISGLISKNYAPLDDTDIKEKERVFYTRENAMYIDSYRYYVDELVPLSYRKFFLAPLLVEASIHVNTCGIFKSFYKDKKTGIGIFGGSNENNLDRIKGKINIQAPILSNHECEYMVYKEDANELVNSLPLVDVAYLDPPYNEHPYGSNYFMLNLILENKINGELSSVVGIPSTWNRSNYNYMKTAYKSLYDLIKKLKARYILLSYNDEGFISFQEIKDMLSSFGEVEIKQIPYITFKGCRNLLNRNIHTHEYLFILKKKEYKD